MKNENRNQSLSRRRFFKQAAVAGAALALPSGLNRVRGGNTPAASKSTGNQTPAAGGAVITARRVLGSGSAAMEVSALGFGVMGMTYNRSQHPGKRECIALLHEAVERGVTLFDTAIIYGPWSNERLAGEALSAFGDHICVTTKFGHEVVDGRATGRLRFAAIAKSRCDGCVSMQYPFSINIDLTRKYLLKRWRGHSAI